MVSVISSKFELTVVDDHDYHAKHSLVEFSGCVSVRCNGQLFSNFCRNVSIVTFSIQTNGYLLVNAIFIRLICTDAHL